MRRIRPSRTTEARESAVGTPDALEALARFQRTRRPRTDREVHESIRYPYPTGVAESKDWDDFLYLAKCRDVPKPRTHKQLMASPSEGGMYWWLPPRHVESPTNQANWVLVSWYKGWPHCRKDGIFVGPINPPWV